MGIISVTKRSKSNHDKNKLSNMEAFYLELTCIYTYMCMYVHLYICISVYVYITVCMCVFVNISMFIKCKDIRLQRVENIFKTTAFVLKNRKGRPTQKYK